MQLVLVQPDIVWEQPRKNFETVTRLLEDVRVKSGALIILPEMFSVGFTMSVDAVAEEEGGPTERFLLDLATRHGSYVLGGLVRRGADERGRNDAFVAGPSGAPVARYTKLHPFSFAGESDYYAPGDKIVVFDWEGLKTAPFICYDVRFPEVYRHAVAKGAGLLVTIANFPRPRIRHWTSLLIARAIENQSYSVGVNRCGSDPNLDYPGRSIVVDPHGRVLVEGAGTEGVITFEIDPDAVTRCRASLPFLEDMRADLVPKYPS